MTDPDPDLLQNPLAGDDAFRQKVLIDFDLRDPAPQVLDSHPTDLSGIPMEAVHTYFTPELTITVYAHDGDGQEVANLLAERPDLPQMIIGHAQLHAESRIDSFSIIAISEKQLETFRQIIREETQKPDSPANP